MPIRSHSEEPLVCYGMSKGCRLSLNVYVSNASNRVMHTVPPLEAPLGIYGFSADGVRKTLQQRLNNPGKDILGPQEMGRTLEYPELLGREAVG